MFGLSSFIISFLIFISGLSYFVGADSTKLLNKWILGLVITLWFSLFFGYFFTNPILGGVIGYEMTDFIGIYIGDIGVLTLLIFGLIGFLVLRLKLTPELIYNNIKKHLVSNKSSEINNEES